MALHRPSLRGLRPRRGVEGLRMSVLWVAVVLAAAPARGVDGGLSLGLVQDVIEWHAPEVNACFAGGAKRPSVRYHFEVGPRGRVVRLAFLDSQRAEAPRVTCVGTALERWPFPAADAGTVVEWEFSTSSIDAGVLPEPEFLAPEQLAPVWVDDASRCYDATNPNETREGRLALDLVVTRAGAVVEANVSLATPALAATELGNCLAAKARSWSGPASSAPRKVSTQWLFASSERRVKLLFLPTAPAKEIFAYQPKVLASAGGLDKDVIYAEIKRSERLIRDCYEAGLRADRALAGKVSVAFVINAEGRVIRSETQEDSLEHEPTTNCILEVVNRMAFPRPEGGVVVNVTFPWIFKTAGDE